MRKSVQLIVLALFLCLLKLPQLESVPQLTVQTSVENSFSYADSICSPISYLDKSLLLFQGIAVNFRHFQSITNFYINCLYLHIIQFLFL
ncbi:hypothetical protein RchiOBHm_Chr7g0223441 [Rosa chinensis]|uniref:Uncharacterized protein n=1 Tax=Rosa chinensis TaxID=74649 RepID=A0A2P6PDK1_ROSCH|nr:hypothetical protein RchiOBHm_Chr7g0223441 [Rosa chinensis]